MTYIIEGYRNILYYHKSPDLKMLAILFVGGIVLSIIGYGVFQKLQKRFAEEM
jgi:ABC-2 type transport system permease protein